MRWCVLVLVGCAGEGGGGAETGDDGVQCEPESNVGGPESAAPECECERWCP